MGISLRDCAHPNINQFCQNVYDKVNALSASTQVELLLAQCAQFKPRYAVMASPAHAALLRQRLAAEAQPPSPRQASRPSAP